MLGNVVTDKITGYQGVAIEVNQWLNGCTRIAVQGQDLTKDGCIPDIVWIDSRQLKNLDLSGISEFNYLGKEVRDKITGYTGIVISESFNLDTDHQVGIQCQKLDSDGKVLPIVYFSTNRIEIIEQKHEPAKRGPGGPQDDPSRSAYNR